jgi:Exopolysaccharide biosynthesis protein YbjH
LIDVEPRTMNLEPGTWNMKQTSVTILLLLLMLSLSPSPALSWDSPFDRAANWGGTGLLEIPSARILDDGVIRAGIAQALPFRWYTLGMGIYPGVEFSGRLTQVTNIAPDFPGQATLKDKAFDLKYQVIPETGWLPAVSLGAHDLFGTRLFEARYIVFNRQIFPFDFTLGYGTNRLEGPFGGVEAAVHPRLPLLAEYNPIDYAADSRSVRGVPEGAAWPVNVGLRFRVLPAVDLGLSYQRGDTIGAMVSFQSPLGEPVLPRRADPPPLVDVDRRPYAQRDPKEMVRKIHDALQAARFTDVSVYTDGENLTAEFVNSQYLSDQKAVGRVLRHLLLHSPEDTKRLNAILKRKGMSILKVSVKPTDGDRA